MARGASRPYLASRTPRSPPACTRSRGLCEAPECVANAGLGRERDLAHPAIHDVDVGIAALVREILDLAPYAIRAAVVLNRGIAVLEFALERLDADDEIDRAAGRG